MSDNAERQLAMGPAGRLASFFIDSKLTPLLVVAALALGLLAVALTPREEEPQIVLPVVDLFVGLPGSSPEEVEKRVTIPLERRMWQIPGVEYVYSSSLEGMSLVTVRFVVGGDQERSLVKVYQELASGLDSMPAGSTLPLIRSRTIDDVPILVLTLHGDGYDDYELRRLASELKYEVEKLDDVAKAQLIGGLRRQVRVLLDPQRLASVGLDSAAVAQALRAQNASLLAGSFEEGNREVLVEAGSFLDSAQDVADVVVGVQDGRPLYLHQVAEVRDGPEEAASRVLYRSAAGSSEGVSPSRPAVSLAVAKRQGADAFRVSERILHRVEALRPVLLPQDVTLSVTRDYGETANEKAGELLWHLVLAILSVSVAIGLFLGWRGALVVFVSVPVSFALTLFVYYLFGYTLNRVTLFALIFVTGIVVDDSIIVVENIVRHFKMRRRGEQGSPMKDAIKAVSEVGNPTILATLTVIASVAPMAFVRGLMGPYMLPMPTGATLAMSFSLLVALVVTPWLAYRLLRSHEGPDHGEAWQVEQSRLYRLYCRILVPFLARPRRAYGLLAGITVLLLLAMTLVPLKQVSLKMLPFDNKSELQVLLDLDEGTTLQQTARVASDVADALVTAPEVTDIESYVGTAAPIGFNGLVRHYDLRSGSNIADLQINLRSKDERQEQSHDIAKRLRPIVQTVAERYGAAAKVVEVPPGPPVLSTLVAEVYGPSEAERQRVAAQVLDIFAATEGVVDTDWMVEAPQTKVVFRVDREKAGRQGVAAAQVAEVLRVALEGSDAGVLHLERELETVPIRLQLPRAARSSVKDLESLFVTSRSGAAVPLSELVTVSQTIRQATRHRKNLRPVVYVTGDVAGLSESPTYSILEMADRIAEIELPSGAAIEQFYRDEPLDTEQAKIKWDGEWQITYEVFRDLGAAFGAVLILIYMLVIGWFRSFKVPLLMMVAIPLSLIGVLPGHWLFGAFFTATSMIGFIALAGIMVRNSVLLIDFAQIALAEGKTLGEAVAKAGAVRLRPIALTAGTVVVGAFVILFDPIFQGLAISLMFGALASTGLTLVVVPLLYFLVERHRYEEPLPAKWD